MGTNPINSQSTNKFNHESFQHIPSIYGKEQNGGHYPLQTFNHILSVYAEK